MTQKDIAFLLLCVLHCTISSLAFVLEDCGSEMGKFNEISISTCDLTAEKCSLIRGKDIHVSMKFTPNVDVSEVVVHAFGVLVGVPVPFPLEKPELCKNPDSGINCPLKKDQEVEYKATFNMKKSTPALSLEVMWQFKNEKDENIVCIKFPVKIE